MAVALHIIPTHMTPSDYHEMIRFLEKTGHHDPEERRFHVAYGEDPVMMFEVWHSRKGFEDYRDALLSALDSVAIGVNSIDLHPVHEPHPD